jgi:hypothetical protein
MTNVPLRGVGGAMPALESKGLKRGRRGRRKDEEEDERERERERLNDFSWIVRREEQS